MTSNIPGQQNRSTLETQFRFFSLQTYNSWPFPTHTHTYRPVVVQMTEFVGQFLHVVRFEP